MQISDQVIDEIVEFINRKINIPYIPESVEAILIKAVLMALFHVLGQKSLNVATSQE